MGTYEEVVTEIRSILDAYVKEVTAPMTPDWIERRLENLIQRIRSQE
jgi:hypothetical protein